MQPFDDAVRTAVYGVASPRATRVLYAITQLGSPLFLIPMTIVASLVFLHLRRIRGAILLTVTMLGVTLLNWMLKIFFQRARPRRSLGLDTPDVLQLPQRPLPGLVLLLRGAGRAGRRRACARPSCAPRSGRRRS